MVKSAVEKLGDVQGPGPVQGEFTNVQTFGGFQESGRVIFDVSAALTSALGLTDADGIPCGELPFPCSSCYLHFGPHSGLLSDGYEIEGAFVQHIEGRLMVDLVPKGWGREYFFALPMGEQMLGVSIDIGDAEKLVANALADSVHEIMAQNARTLAEMSELEAKLSAQYGQVVKVPFPGERLDDKEPLLRKALGLIANVLFYLAAEPADVVEEWGRDTPQEALNALRAVEKPGSIRAMENTLLKAGYRKVRFVGRTFAESVASKDIHNAAQTGRVLATHFRRGHFKRQAYGPERALRKTIFVAPVVVNPDRGMDQIGRIYQVG